MAISKRVDKAPLSHSRAADAGMEVVVKCACVARARKSFWFVERALRLLASCEVGGVFRVRVFYSRNEKRRGGGFDARKSKDKNAA